MHYVSSNTTEFIRNNFFEQSFADRKPSFEKFKELTTAAQLHYLADIYNWDDGIEVLNWVVDSPLLDFGTAMLIFWRAEPVHYTIYSTVEDADYDGEVLSLLLKIIDRFKSGKFNSSRIKYDPIADHYDVNEILLDAKWIVPSKFKKATPGRRVITTEGINGFLLFAKRFFKEIKRQRVRNRRKKQ